ncbi:MAG: hypothetical protein H7210_08525 [Pyrinomonadaceae bacterium]|nr:hypothetical protein [Phycisphaerales bacterium]
MSVSLPGEEVRPGETIALRVGLRPYNGAEYSETIAVRIPDRLAGETVLIEVASGSVAKPDTPLAESLSNYLENLGRYFPPTSIVVGLQTWSDGASLHGRLLPELPAAAADTLRPGNQTRRADAFRVVERTIHPTRRLVTGRQEITVHVREDALGAGLAGPPGSPDRAGPALQRAPTSPH